MNIEEIRKNAPDGATHYREFSCTIRFIKLIGVEFFFWHSEKWIKSNLQNEANRCLGLGLIKPLN